MKRIIAIVAALAFCLCGASARAAIGVGDSVSTVAFKTADGVSVNLAQYKGKLVLMDFWATWCGPCMHEAPHMVEINQKYAAKGLVLVGVSLDRDPAAMKQGAKAAGLNWPQTIDGGKLSSLFGVDSIPRTFLVGPDGKVLWTGHPASGLDQAITDAFKNHPPQMVDPKVLADAKKTLDLVQEKLTANDAKGALKLMTKVPAAARADGDLEQRSQDIQKKLEDVGETMLGEVDPLIAKADYQGAVSRLKDISDGLSGLPVAAKAKSKMLELTAKPEVKTALAAAQKAQRDAERSAKAADALAAAQKLADDKKDDQAYTHFRLVAAEYSGTEAGAAAAEQVKAYERQHPELIKKMNESASANKAKAALSMAGSYKRAGRNDLAKAKYEGVVKDFPNTGYAQTAQDELNHLSE